MAKESDKEAVIVLGIASVLGLAYGAWYFMKPEKKDDKVKTVNQEKNQSAKKEKKDIPKEGANEHSTDAPLGNDQKNRKVNVETLPGMNASAAADQNLMSVDNIEENREL
jgi:hypothetical protein